MVWTFYFLALCNSPKEIRDDTRAHRTVICAISDRFEFM